MAATLSVRYDGRTVEVEPDRRFVLGRSRTADLSLPLPDVSREHASLYFDDGWWIADHGSANGTYVDGRRISEPTRIDATTMIRLGGPDSPAAIEVIPPPLDAVLSGEAAWHEQSEGTVLKGDVPQPFRSAPAPPALAPGAATTTLGKAPDNDVVLDDVNVSRHHARVVVADGGLLVEDLGSLNGTLLNAVPVQRAFMSESDVLTIGNTDFVQRSGRLISTADLEDAGRGLRVRGLGYTIRSGKQLIRGLDVVAGRGTLTAVIGPSGAGKSTLAGLLAGVSAPTAGDVLFDGFDLQRDYRAVKTRIGLVPQDDVVHRQLRLQRALRYAASLRLPARLPGAVKSAQVERTVEALGLEKHADTRIERLSGGQRKRASVALELLTEPSLLILDEPTSGLDPALDRQVMRTLRELADGGRTVVVVTHSVAYLRLCDQVLVLAPGGMPAYLGPADEIDTHFGTDDWADVFAALAEDPEGSWDRWKAVTALPQLEPIPASDPVRRAPEPAVDRLLQWWTVLRRQVATAVADHGYLAFLLALPFVLGLLPAVVPGSAGLNPVPANRPSEASEPTSILALLIIGATFAGVAMSARDLVGERAIFLRERAVGLSPAAYLMAKLAFFGAFSAFSSAILVLVVSLVKPAPERDVLGLPPLVELFLAIALMMWVSAALGLAISAFVGSNDQVMPALIVVLMIQIVLHGGLITVLHPQWLDVLSRFVPARWGFAATASGVDLQALVSPGLPSGAAAPDRDPLWAHRVGQWVRDMGVLAAFGVAFSGVGYAGLRRSAR